MKEPREGAATDEKATSEKGDSYTSEGEDARRPRGKGVVDTRHE